MRAPRRRIDLMDQKERARKEAEAYFLACVRGRGGRRRGEGVGVRGRVRVGD